MSSGSKPQSCAPLSHGPSVTKHKFKDEMTENFKMVTTEHQSPYVGHCLCACEVGYLSELSRCYRQKMGGFEADDCRSWGAASALLCLLSASLRIGVTVLSHYRLAL